MWSWFTFFLIGHILSVLVAFGPVFAFPLIAAESQKDRVHGRFGAEIIDLIERKITLRAAGVVALFGIGLIFTAHVDFFSSPWILIAVALYILAYLFAGLVQAKNSAKMVELLRAMPPGPPPEGTPPPPEILALGKKLQYGGMYLTLSIVAIIVLMVWRPGATFTH
jgi:uncharacterized membrane protein